MAWHVLGKQVLPRNLDCLLNSPEVRRQLVSKAIFPPLPLLKAWFFWSVVWAGMLTYSRLHSPPASNVHSRPGGSLEPSRFAEPPSRSGFTSLPRGCARRPAPCKGSRAYPGNGLRAAGLSRRMVSIALAVTAVNTELLLLFKDVVLFH